MLPGMVIGVEATQDKAADDINSSLTDIEYQLKPISLPEIPQPDIELPKPKIPRSAAEFAVSAGDTAGENESPVIEKISFISFDQEALKALRSARISSEAELFRPSASSAVTNNYSYNTVTGGSEKVVSQTVTIPVTLVMDGKIIADGVADIVLDEVDKQQGIAVQMKKRGVAQ